MSTWRVNSSNATQWAPNTAYSLGQKVVCRTSYGTTARRAFVYECTTAGTSHGSTEPTWPTSGTVNDNDVVWTCRNPNDGDWNNASPILHYVLNHSAIAAGDSVYIHKSHSENIDIGSAYYTLKGSTTKNNPINIYCVDKDNSDSLDVGAVILSSNATYAMLFTCYAFCYGVTFKTPADIRFDDTTNGVGWIFEGSGNTVVLEFTNESAAKYIYTHYSHASQVSYYIQLRKAAIKFARSDQCILLGGMTYFHWIGGSVVAPSGLVKLIATAAGNYSVRSGRIEDVDLDEIGDGENTRGLISAGLVNDIIFARCKLPSDAGFSVLNGSWTYPKSGKIILHHCSGADKYYDFAEYSYEGVNEDDITVYRSGGASDGVNGLSVKMASSADVDEGVNGLDSPPIFMWNTNTTEKTFTIEGVFDGATNLQNNEVWMELEYPADNTSGLGAVSTSRCVPLGVPADLSASTETWEGTSGFSNENKFKLSVTCTPGKAGPVTARVYLAKASTTVYIDPKITVS